jgi:hypothetical protein
MMHAESISRPVLVLTPVFNDWIAFHRLVAALDDTLMAARVTARVLAVDDGSNEKLTCVPDACLKAIISVDVLKLRRNLGHQRAIAVGLAYVCERESSDVVVMDSDGEDDPHDVPRLLDKLRQEEGRAVVFAERSRRSENLMFRFWYGVYRSLHYILTGRGVRFGNFSAIPYNCLTALVGVTELWNHYAAGVVKSRQRYCTIPTQRGKRLHGATSMRYVDLVVHGLSAISVYSDVVGVRLLIGLLILVAMVVSMIATTVAIRMFTPLAIPGWATNVVGVSVVLLFQAALFAGFLSFLILSGRQASSFLPLRDYSYFVLGIHSLYPIHDGATLRRD